jgi:hypothetical protein
MKPFNLEAALRGEPVWHVNRKLHVENLTQVGVRVAYTIPEDGDMVYSCLLNGNGTGCFENEAMLAMKPKTHTFYINIWNSPSKHYTLHNTLEAAQRDVGLSSQSKSFYRHKKLNLEPIAITIEE